MGLLSRAADRTVLLPLDEMGQALQERIRRLPQNKTTPYTALSLLKAYGAFQAGICLSLKNDIYSSYASVGIGIEKISIPREKIWSREIASKKYFRFDSEQSIGMKNRKDNFIYWVFPLQADILSASADNNTEPWAALVILAVADSAESHSAEANSAFNPQSVSVILEGISDKLLMQTSHKSSEATPEADSEKEVPEESGSAESISGEPSSEGTGTLEGRIAQYHKMYANFNCIILENPCRAGEPEYNSAENNSGDKASKANFCKRVSDMISMTGTVIPLSSLCPLILFPAAMDRELIAHRLSKSLDTRPLMSFEANSPENVLNQINSLT